MRLTSKWIFPLIAIAAVLLIVAGRCKSTSPLDKKIDASSLVLQSYKVPQQYGSDTEMTLNKLFSLGKESIGRAYVAPNGDLLVAAPANFQPGIQSFMANLNKSGSAPTPTIQVKYRIVLSRKGEEKTSLDDWGELKPALEAIEKSQGPQKFSLAEQLTTNSLSSKEVTIKGAYSIIRTTATASGDQIVLSVDIDALQSLFHTTIQIPEKKLLVLGQSSCEVGSYSVIENVLGLKKEDALAGGKGTLLVSIYYIIEAERLK